MKFSFSPGKNHGLGHWTDPLTSRKSSMSFGVVKHRWSDDILPFCLCAWPLGNARSPHIRLLRALDTCGHELGYGLVFLRTVDHFIVPRQLFIHCHLPVDAYVTRV